MHGSLNFRNRQTARSIESAVHQEHVEDGQKTNDWANCKGQLALTVRAGHARSHPRVPWAHQAGLSRRSLAGVGLSESV
ncbi:hypothetical protein TNCV_1551831 [Trichonephila clavipes]|nr:hypothetical protein TNCV_1551831 [Trichonephila clavipes]